MHVYFSSFYFSIRMKSTNAHVQRFSLFFFLYIIIIVRLVFSLFSLSLAQFCNERKKKKKKLHVQSDIEKVTHSKRSSFSPQCDVSVLFILIIIIISYMVRIKERKNMKKNCIEREEACIHAMKELSWLSLFSLSAIYATSTLKWVYDVIVFIAYILAWINSKLWENHLFCSYYFEMVNELFW